jgi:hypothetical protein
MLRHIWDRYVNSGIANPNQRKVLAQLQVSGQWKSSPANWQCSPAPAGCGAPVQAYLDLHAREVGADKLKIHFVVWRRAARSLGKLVPRNARVLSEARI